MDEKLSADGPADLLPARDYTIVAGHGLARDPGQAQLRRYLPVLAVIAAPFAGLGGDQDPLNPLDPVAEWRALLRGLDAATHLQAQNATRLALVRLLPPTGDQLGEALAVGGADAFRVVHLVCHGERDMLYLEDQDGHEAYAVAEHLVKLFKASGARLVVMDGCFSRHTAQLLISETPVQAVVGTRRRVAPDNALSFNAHFYAELTAGTPVRAAFRTAVNELKRQAGGQADRYELVIDEDVHEVALPLPPPDQRATRPLLDAGGPLQIGVPPTLGFVGRRDLLNKLAGDIPASGHGLYAFHGPHGVGKSWLIAGFVNRFGWRFPDGIAWVDCLPVTTTQEVIARLAGLLGLPVHTPAQDVLAALEGRHALLVIDGIDAVEPPAERERLWALLRQIAARPPGCAVVTALQPAALDMPAEGGRVRAVTAFDPKDARTLAMRLAVERGVDALDVDTIDDFLDRTLSNPWLIVRGVELVGASGIEGAFETLKTVTDAADPVPGYLRRQIEWLAVDETNPLKLLVRAQGLPDAFDERTALGLGGSGATDHLALLLRHGLLRREGTLYAIPNLVRALIAERFAFQQPQQDRVDRVVMEYLAQTWPDERSGDESLDPGECRARLNNVRALLRRQLRPERGLDPALVVRVLVATAPAFCRAGLAEEYVAYAQAYREQLPDRGDLARLQVAMGEVMAALPGHETESGWLFQVTVRLDGADRPALAEASLALGRHLLRVEQTETAADVLARAFKAVVSRPEGTDVRLAASLALEWGRALVALGRYSDAIKRFEGALAGYARTRQAALSAVAQCELGEALARVGALDRAQEALRHALATADFVGRRDLAAGIRHKLALVHMACAEQSAGQPAPADADLAAAEDHLSAAVTDLLAGDDALARAAVYHELARVLAQRGRVADGVEQATRSRALYARAGTPRDLAEVTLTLGQLYMAEGNAVAAQTALHEALDMGAALDDEHIVERAAGVLVRVHQIRARYARQADRQFRRDTLDQAGASRARLVALGLNEHAAALDQVVQRLASA